MTPFNIYKEIGIPFTVFFAIIGFYLVYAIIKIIGETPKNGGLDWVNEFLPTDAGMNYHSSWLESSIDRVWLEYDARISHLIGSIGGCVNATILVGFFGTILGAILAFKDMGQCLTSGSFQANEAIKKAFDGGLNTALYTSLLSSIIGGVVIGFMAVVIQPRVKKFEARIGSEICGLLKGFNQPKTIDRSGQGGTGEQTLRQDEN